MIVFIKVREEKRGVDNKCESICPFGDTSLDRPVALDTNGAGGGKEGGVEPAKEGDRRRD